MSVLLTQMERHAQNTEDKRTHTHTHTHRPQPKETWNDRQTTKKEGARPWRHGLPHTWKPVCVHSH